MKASKLWLTDESALGYRASHFNFICAYKSIQTFTKLLVNEEKIEKPIAPEIIVDLGCGVGFTTNLLAKIDSCKKVIGIDSSPAMLKIATTQPKLMDPNFFLPKKLDLEVDPIDLDTETVDMVTSFAVLSYLEKIENVFKETSRILKPGQYFGFDLLIHDKHINAIKVNDKTTSTEYFSHRADVIKYLLENQKFNFISSSKESKLTTFLFQKK